MGVAIRLMTIQNQPGTPGPPPPSGGRTYASHSAATLDFTFTDPAIVESSGLAYSRQHPNIVWTHNDTGTPYLFAVDTTTGATACKVLLSPPSGAVIEDIEDIAWSPGPQPSGYLWIADTGNNSGTRSDRKLLRILEPDLLVDQTIVPDVYMVSWPDANVQSCEAIMVRPADSRIYLAMRANQTNPAGNGLYRAPAPMVAGVGNTNLLTEVIPLVPDQVTGADWSPEDRYYALVSGAGQGRASISLYTVDSAPVDTWIAETGAGASGRAVESVAWDLTADNLLVGHDGNGTAAMPNHLVPILYGTIVDPPVDMPLVTPVSAQSLWRMSGVNVQPSYLREPSGYTSEYADITEELNVSIVRDDPALSGSTGTRQRQFMLQLMNGPNKAQWHMTTISRQDWPQMAATHQAVLDYLRTTVLPLITTGGTDRQKIARHFHSFAGYNEIDEGGPTNPLNAGPGGWSYQSYIQQVDLMARIRNGTGNNVIFNDCHIASVSTRTDFPQYPSRAAQLRSHSSQPGGLWDDIVTMPNVHRYYSAQSPRTYITEALDAARSYIGLPVSVKSIASETGGNDAHYARNIQATTPRDVIADYLVRGLFDFADYNCVSIWFQIMDRPDYVNFASQATIDSTVTNSNHWGMVGLEHHPAKNAGETDAEYQDRLYALNTPDTWYRKPQFWAVRRLMNELRDDTDTAVLTPLPLEVVGGGADLHWRLFRRSNGVYGLALYRDVETYRFSRTGTSVYTPVTDVNVTVRVGVACTVDVVKPAGDNPQQTDIYGPTETAGTDETFPAPALTTGANRLNGGTLAAGETFKVNVGGSLLLARITPT